MLEHRSTNENKQKIGQIGFLNDKRRLNVALTRAKFCLIVVGHAGTLKENNDAFRDLIANAHRRGRMFTVPVDHKQYLADRKANEILSSKQK